MTELLGSVDVLVWLACAYGGFLLLAAYGIDAASRFVARFNTSWKSGGFTYLSEEDVWRCPQGQLLRPARFDPDDRVMHYRADPDLCNVCPVKAGCTSSDEGREMHRVVGPSWPASEAERFQHVLSLAPVVVAVVWPALTLVSGRNVAETVLLVLTILVVALGSVPLWRRLRRSAEPPSPDPDDAMSTGTARSTGRSDVRGRDDPSCRGHRAVPTFKETR